MQLVVQKAKPVDEQNRAQGSINNELCQYA
jgi:hypothetical protein